MPKTKKSLILYQTMTGNTELVVQRFEKVFKDKGWECDVFKVDKETDVDNLPFDFNDYDFMCAGSGVYMALPGRELTDIMFKTTHRTRRAGKIVRLHRKITIGPRKGIVFVTYAGTHLGPKEAEPALSLLELNIEHLKFRCVGKFACPGKIGKKKTPGYWFGDISDRPNERDLTKAEIFLAEKLEEP